MATIIKADMPQVRAARLIVKRAERGIGEASPRIRAMANAKQVKADVYEPDAFEAVLEDDATS
ncbi:MAG: hypothetical protein ACT4PP_07595 [Sporichthyaceae bacterium]